MFRNIGTTEIVVIAIVLFVLFAGKKLPELGRGLGDAIKEFKKALGGKEN
jgi:sec-independent protein translocase protein TatA